VSIFSNTCPVKKYFVLKSDFIKKKSQKSKEC
jgi:hypothetical protein